MKVLPLSAGAASAAGASLEAAGADVLLELPVLPPNCEIAGQTKREEAKNLIKYLCTIVPDADVKMMHAITNTEKYGLWDRMRLKQSRGEIVPQEED